MPDNIFIFYGYSGDPSAPTFPDGEDADKTFQLAAETLCVTLKKLGSTSTPPPIVKVIQAWTKNKIIDALSDPSIPPRSVTQVHIATHASGPWLSLALRHDGSRRLRERSTRFNTRFAAASNEMERIRIAKDAVIEEDALVSGLFDALDNAIVDTIKQKMHPNASWQIWGCYAGSEVDVFSGGTDYPEVDEYQINLNVLATKTCDYPANGDRCLEAIAYHIARALGVQCTAATDGFGTQFWYSPKGRKVEKSHKHIRDANRPFWLWSTTGSSWITWEPDPTDTNNARTTAQPFLFGAPRQSNDLPTPKPPAWFTNLYWAPEPEIETVFIIPTFEGGPDRLNFSRLAPSENLTVRIGSILASKNCVAPFFIQTHVPFRLGADTDINPGAEAALRELRNQNHLIEILSGSSQDNFLHTLGLPHTTSDPNRLEQDLINAREKIQTLLEDEYQVRFVRPVDGKTYDSVLRKFVFETYQSLGLNWVSWDVDSRDNTVDLSAGGGRLYSHQKVENRLSARVVELVGNRNPIKTLVLRFHDVNRTTAQHLEGYLNAVEGAIMSSERPVNFAYPNTQEVLRNLLNGREPPPSSGDGCARI